MEDFAKLFNTEKHGQILVKLDEASDSDAAEVRLFFKPKGLGVCSIALTFSQEDNERRWDLAEKAFATLGLEDAVRMVESVSAHI